jgi:hypothetical protein
MQQILPHVPLVQEDKKRKRKQNKTCSKLKAVSGGKGTMDTITAIKM